MMNKDLFLYGNVTKEQFEMIKGKRDDFNYKNFRKLSAVAVIYFIILFFSTFSFNAIKTNNVIYGISAIFALGIHIALITVAKPGSKLLLPLMYIESALLLVFSILIGAIFVTDQLVVSFHVFLILLPLIIVDKPYRLSILELLATIAIIVCCIVFKNGETRNLDIINLVVFSLMGQFIIYYMISKNIGQFVTLKNVEIASYLDDMTQISNRKAYERDISNYKNYIPEKDFVFVVFDVNELKKANDGLGHGAGDELLIGAADCIKNCFGKYGKTYRTGGDEFVAIIHAERSEVEKIVERYRNTVSNWSGKLVKSLSMSMGYAIGEEFPEMTALELGKTADMRMYKEKNAYHESLK